MLLFCWGSILTQMNAFSPEPVVWQQQQFLQNAPPFSPALPAQLASGFSAAQPCYLADPCMPRSYPGTETPFVLPNFYSNATATAQPNNSGTFLEAENQALRQENARLAVRMLPSLGSDQERATSHMFDCNHTASDWFALPDSCRTSVVCPNEHVLLYRDICIEPGCTIEFCGTCQHFKACSSCKRGAFAATPKPSVIKMGQTSLGRAEAASFPHFPHQDSKTQPVSLPALTPTYSAFDFRTPSATEDVYLLYHGLRQISLSLTCIWNL